jgi:hypothetical protein
MKQQPTPHTLHLESGRLRDHFARCLAFEYQAPGRPQRSLTRKLCLDTSIKTPRLGISIGLEDEAVVTALEPYGLDNIIVDDLHCRSPHLPLEPVLCPEPSQPTQRAPALRFSFLIYYYILTLI